MLPQINLKLLIKKIESIQKIISFYYIICLCMCTLKLSSQYRICSQNILIITICNDLNILLLRQCVVSPLHVTKEIYTSNSRYAFF